MSKKSHTISDDEIVSFLQATEFFRRLDADALRKIVKQVEAVFLSGGTVLLQQGEIGTDLYLVITGRLRVIKEDKNESDVILDEVGRGELIGELALFTQEPRAATVVAIRDTVVIKLSKAEFDEFICNYPKQAMEIAKHSMLRLMRKHQRKENTTVTIAIAAAGRGRLHHEFAYPLVEELTKLGPTCHIDSKKIDTILQKPGIAQSPLTSEYSSVIAHWLNENESEYRYIVYEMDDNNSNWCKRCLHQADRVLLIADATDDDVAINSLEENIFSQHERIRRVTDLVLLHPAHTVLPRNTAAWLAPRGVDTHHHLRKNGVEDLQRLSRFITGRARALVLSGGGARALAHLGVLKALRELKIPVDMIGGTSAGALIGALIAMNNDVENIIKIVSENIVHNKELFEITAPMVSFLSGRGWSKAMREVYGAETQIEDLWRPFFCVSTNLSQGQLQLHNQGQLWRAIRASVSLPAVVPPISYGENELLVDGGVINNLPVDIMRQFCNGGKIIASDISAKTQMLGKISEDGYLSGWGLLAKYYNAFNRQPREMPNIAEIILQSIMLASSRHRISMSTQADYYIPINTHDFKLLNFKPVKELIAVGYQAAIEALAGKL